MEIIKQNETYQISESTENGWNMLGTVSKDSSGSLNMSFAVGKPGELVENIGDFNYYKPLESEMISVNYNTTEVNRKEFTTYADTVISTVLKHFSTEE